MTRKDYKLIADVINWISADMTSLDSGASTLDLVIERLSSRLKDDNPNFDAVRFRRACGVTW